MKPYVVEALGTFILAFAALMTGNPAIIGLALMSAIYIGAHISGAHYNPAITTGAWARKHLARSASAPLYMLAQLVGALLAVGLIHCLTQHVPGLPTAEGDQMWKSVVTEALGAFIILLVFLHFASERARANGVYGFGIGLTVAMAVAVGMGLSAAVFNPAIAAALLISCALKSDMPNVHLFTAYVLSPFIGGLAASYVHGYLND